MSPLELLRRAAAPFAELRGRVLWIVVGGLICQFGLGYGYVYGHVQTDITEELGWARATFSSARIPLMVMMSIASPLVGFAFLRFGVRPILVISVVLLFSATTVLSSIQELWHFWAAAGLQGLAAVGVGDVVVGAVVTQWVVRGRGLALGIVYSGANLAGTLLSLGVPRLSAVLGWREALFIAGLVGAAVMLPFAAWILRAPRPGERSAEHEDAELLEQTSEDDLDVWQAMRTRSFWILCFALSSFFFIFVGAIDHLVPAMRDRGLDGTSAGDLFALVTGSAIVSKIGFGVFTDWLGDHRRSMWIQSGVFAASSALLYSVPTSWMTPIVLIAFGLSTAARDVIYPLIIDYCFGPRYLAQIYGAIMGMLWSGAVGTLFAGAIFDRLGSYDLAFHTSGALAIAAFFAVLFLRNERPSALPTRR